MNVRQEWQETKQAVKSHSVLKILVIVWIILAALILVAALWPCDCGNEVASYSDYLNSDYLNANEGRYSV